MRMGEVERGFAAGALMVCLDKYCIAVFAWREVNQA